MHTQRRYSKRALLGRLRIDYLFSNDQLPGITPESSRWEVLAAFLKAGDARAERLIETEGGMIFLQSIPSGRIRERSMSTTNHFASSSGSGSTGTTT